MILSVLVERMQGLASGGVITNESRWFKPYLENVAHGFLAKTILAQYNGSRYMAKNQRINPLYYRKVYPIFRPELQDKENCFVAFDCPSILSFDQNSDGIRYCGTLNGTYGFNRIHTREKLSDINNHRVMRIIKGQSMSFLYDGNTKLIEVYGDLDLQECLLEIIPQNPLDIPTFNRETDDYIADADVPLFLSMNFPEETRIEKSSTADLLPSGSEKQTPQKP